MKQRLNTLLIAGLTALSSLAVNPSDFIIYVNPGHGGHNGANDRNIVIAPFEEGDTAGFWESNSNMDKGFRLRELLWEKGYNVVMSRVSNTEEDDLNLSTIGYLANASGADLFLSIHSNATGTEARRNFPLMLYKGYDNEEAIAGSQRWATIAGDHLYTNQSTVWTNTVGVRGDWSFYTSWGDKVGLGVLRQLTIPNMLSEGSFHDYIPETYRLMSQDFKWLEAWNFRKAINEYFGVEGVDYGAIAGRINDDHFLREGDFKMFDADIYASADEITVGLYDVTGATKIEECITDNLKNGIYAFRRVEPGTYKLKFSSDTHDAVELNDIVVTADEVTYANVKMTKTPNTPPVLVSHSPVWNETTELVKCNEPLVLEFNWGMDTVSVEEAFSIEPAVEGTITWEDQNFRMIFTPSPTYARSTKYTVRINNTAKHAAGVVMENPVEFTFLTDDRDYMKITGLFPNEGDKVHFDGANIEVRFDKHPAMKYVLDQVKCYDSKGTAVSLNKRAWKYSKTGDEYGYFRIPFTKDLTIGETYTLELSNEISDNDGITIKEGLSLKFSAVDAGEAKTEPSIETMDDATLYAQNEFNCTDVKSVTVAANTADALFDKCVSFTYEFNGTANGEAIWSRSTATETELTSADAIGVHVYGDLSGNAISLEMSSDIDIKYVKLCDMTFLGWRYIVVPLTVLEGNTYKMSGVAITQQESIISRKGTAMLDNINVIENGALGVDNIVADVDADVTVYPNPASEYLISSADGLIQRIELVSMSGSVIASATGNVLNVSEITEGQYLARIYASGGVVMRKVVIAH